jgi:protocatechuate 4,5-dioxygenase beta chain
MAKLIGGIATSHVPAIGRAMAEDRFEDPYWASFFKGYEPARAWLQRERPDVAVVFYNDHGLNFFLDNLPTFAVGAGPQYANADEGWGLPLVPPYPGDQALSWRLVEDLVAEEFDIATCQSMQVDHALWIPMALLWPGDARPVRVIPIEINTVQHPLPSPARCFKLGEAVGRSIARWPDPLKVVVIGTGGLSHQLEGERAGFLNKDFDRECLAEIVDTPERLTRFSNLDLIERAGSQGVELLMWLAMRGAVGAGARLVTEQYHVPISNTAAGLMVLESAPAG